MTILKVPDNTLISNTIIIITLLFVSFSLLRHRAWTVEYMMDLIKEKEEKLEESYEKLKSLDKMKSEFFTNLSHEMKTPLTLISNYMESYIKNHKNNVEEEILVIKKNIDKLLTDMINFFDIQKYDRGLTRDVIRRSISRIIKSTFRSYRSSCEFSKQDKKYRNR